MIELPPRTDSAFDRSPPDRASDCAPGRAAGRAPDRANVMVQPPVLLILVVTVGYGLDFFMPLTFLPAGFPAAWVGGGVWLVGFALAGLAIAQFRSTGVEEQVHTPTAEIVDSGLFAFSRNPIYVGTCIAIVGVAIVYNMLWILAMLVPFYFVIRYGVVAREEEYLERMFGDAYLDYKTRVRRWI